MHPSEAGPTLMLECCNTLHQQKASLRGNTADSQTGFGHVDSYTDCVRN